MEILRVSYSAKEQYTIEHGSNMSRVKSYDELWQHLRDHLRVQGVEHKLEFSGFLPLDTKQRAALESIVAYHNDIVRTDRKH